MLCHSLQWLMPLSCTLQPVSVTTMAISLKMLKQSSYSNKSPILSTTRPDFASWTVSWMSSDTPIVTLSSSVSFYCACLLSLRLQFKSRSAQFSLNDSRHCDPTPGDSWSISESSSRTKSTASQSRRSSSRTRNLWKIWLPIKSDFVTISNSCLSVATLAWQTSTRMLASSHMQLIKELRCLTKTWRWTNSQANLANKPNSWDSQLDKDHLSNLS